MSKCNIIKFIITTSLFAASYSQVFSFGNPALCSGCPSGSYQIVTADDEGKMFYFWIANCETNSNYF